MPTTAPKLEPTTAPKPVPEWKRGPKRELEDLIKVLIDYVGTSFDSMNNAMRNPSCYRHIPEMHRRLKSANEDFVTALTSDKLKLTRYDGVLFRGVPADYMRPFEKGKNYKVAGFCSTSMCEKVARRFADGDHGNSDLDDDDDDCEKGTLFKIYQSRTNPKGRILCSGLLEPHFPTNNDEQEVTFPPGTRFHIEEVEYIKYGNYSKIVSLRELDDEVAV